jgi:hypothetical protein
LLKVTKANVCANMVVARSFFANTMGIRTAERRSCGTKATVSALHGEPSASLAEFRYRRIL